MTGPILVFGRDGQVARELADLAEASGRAMTFAGRGTLDLSDPKAVDSAIEGLIAEIGPGAVINAAAYTAVDRAEGEPDAAFALNRDAPAAMARACAARGLPFTHFSTDYVFDGTLDRPYVETDPTGPTGVYGASKLAGEQAVSAAGGPAITLRTSWVYGAHGANFVRTMLRLAGDRDEIGVVADQIGRPTWARDCARAALLATDALARDPGLAGVYHLSGAGDASWADLAAAIFAESARRGGPTARVRAITTADYPTPAKRPANSRLDCGKIETALPWRCRPWRESLAACMNEMEF
ncbi:dTDP-4-dehydrorhamnose reductase [Caulobacter sp. Root1455]|uniref:dTDP-4-dehydrorhamnose reductase n=1 Tax=Caulobacter sp. Root1455 TaxID=1736465 RepID=UPI0006F75E1E|nr:dTDP-4-dehydrorhamnose reductase [Caulobacter sp. Root1455]KQY93231.1 dTDP-4-dehydrorhamnose reductase [Caulobacter sp. Root1455]